MKKHIILLIIILFTLFFADKVLGACIDAGRFPATEQQNSWPANPTCPGGYYRVGILRERHWNYYRKYAVCIRGATGGTITSCWGNYGACSPPACPAGMVQIAVAQNSWYDRTTTATNLQQRICVSGGGITAGTRTVCSGPLGENPCTPPACPAGYISLGHPVDHHEGGTSYHFRFCVQVYGCACCDYDPPGAQGWTQGTCDAPQCVHNVYCNQAGYWYTRVRNKNTGAWTYTTPSGCYCINSAGTWGCCQANTDCTASDGTCYNTGTCWGSRRCNNRVWTDCSSYNGNYCNGDIVERRGYFCSRGTCNYVASFVENCNSRDGWYCNGATREYRDYRCSGGSCTYSVTQSENCNNYDGWYCNGATREYRDYGCSGGGCTYSVTQSQNCGSNYCEGWGSNYCKDNDVYHSRTCHNRGCSGSSCYDNTYTNEEKVQECGVNGCSGGACCECSSGVCCDGCNFRPSSYVCNSRYQTDYGCPWGTGCGADVGVRYTQRYCSGGSASCGGAVSGWGSWSVQDACGATEICADNDPTCNNIGGSELIANGNCNDGLDNDCDGESDYDSQNGLHGDSGCPVSVTAISVSGSNPVENTAITVDCTSSVAGVNSISARIDGEGSCAWQSWIGNIARFSCNVGPYTGSSKTVRCYVDTAKSYKSGTDKTRTISLRASSCSVYSTQAVCEGDAACDWCFSCSGTKWSGGGNRCVNAGTCSYYCWRGQCGATCDPTQGGCGVGESCDTGTCSCVVVSCNPDTYGNSGCCDNTVGLTPNLDTDNPASSFDLGSCAGGSCYNVGFPEAAVVSVYDDLCCGDDSGEYFITAGVGPNRCCNNANDCVDSGGVCRSGTDETIANGNCDNGIDDDCDGLTDADDPDCCSCTPWVKNGCCGIGSANQERTCTPAGCDPEGEQRCVFDATCICMPGQTSDCSKQDGVCAGSQQVCTGFSWPGCSDADYSQHSIETYGADYYEPIEITLDDGLDNDCDGLTDECPDGTTRRHRECALGVCVTDESDWACCDSWDDCVFNSGCYMDADRASQLIGSEIIAKCEGYDKHTDCRQDPDCDWRMGSCKVNVKDSMYHDSVYHDVNPGLEGEEYCDPGTWVNDELEEAAIIQGTVYNLNGEATIEGARVTALGRDNQGNLLNYENYSDGSGFYSILVVIGDITYDVTASKTDYIPQTKQVYAPIGEIVTTDFNLRYNSNCDSDCTYFDDNLCHADCDNDPNGCNFYDQRAIEVCATPPNEKQPGHVMQYSFDPELDIVCCDGEPYTLTPYRAVTRVNTTGNIVTIRKPVWYGGKLVNMIITFFD